MIDTVTIKKGVFGYSILHEGGDEVPDACGIQEIEIFNQVKNANGKYPLVIRAATSPRGFFQIALPNGKYIIDLYEENFPDDISFEASTFSITDENPLAGARANRAGWDTFPTDENKDFKIENEYPSYYQMKENEKR